MQKRFSQGMYKERKEGRKGGKEGRKGGEGRRGGKEGGREVTTFLHVQAQ